MVALSLFPFDALLPKWWFTAYVALIALLPVLVLVLIAISIRKKSWTIPQRGEVQLAQIPEEVRRYAQPWLGRLGFLGFANQGCSSARDGNGHDNYEWRMVHGTDRCVALVKAVVLSPEARPLLQLTLLSFLPDGRVVVSADREVTPIPPSHWEEAHGQFSTLQEQTQFHSRRMEGQTPLMPEISALANRLAAEEQALFDALLASGQFVAVSSESPTARAAFAALPKLALRRCLAFFTGAAYGSGRRTDVAAVPKRRDADEEATPAAEFKRTKEQVVEDYLQRYRARTKRKPDGKYYFLRILFTVIQVGALFFIFGKGNPVSTVLAALGLIAVHDFGHWVMMKLFGYRDMGAFFIPFVSPVDRGRKFHAPAWQQLVVVLAGPVPGLVAGMAVLVIGYFLPGLPPLAPEIGAMAVVLNAFHLLPFLPLDGGKVVDLLIFRDLPFLRPFFTLGSAAAVFAASVFVGPAGRVLRYVAITMFAGLAWDIKMIKVVRGGRRLGWADAEDEDETLRRIFKGIHEEENDGFFRDATWPRQIEVLLSEVMRKRPGILMRVFGGGLYGALFVLPFALVIGSLAVASFGLFGTFASAAAGGEEYEKDFPVTTAAIQPAHLVPLEELMEATHAEDEDDTAGLLGLAGERRTKLAAGMSARLLPMLDRLNWQHAGLGYHQGYFHDHELSLWLEVLCGKFEESWRGDAHAAALVRAEMALHAVNSLEPAMSLGDRELLRDAELRALVVIERLGASGKLDAATLDRLDKRISLLNKAPLPEVENKLLVSGWSEACLQRAIGPVRKESARKDDDPEMWQNAYRLIGEGIENLGSLGKKPVCLALAAEWKKSRRVGTLPENLAGAENISPPEADYIIRFCDGHSRMAWRRLVALSALRLEAHRLKNGSLPTTWKHALPGGAVVALDQSAGPYLRLSDMRGSEQMKLPAWVRQAGAKQASLDYACPLFGAPELSKK